MLSLTSEGRHISVDNANYRRDACPARKAHLTAARVRRRRLSPRLRPGGVEIRFFEEEQILVSDSAEHLIPLSDIVRLLPSGAC